MGNIDTNADDVADWLEEQADEFEDDVEQMLENVTENTYERARLEVPVDTGQLRDSIQQGENEVFSDLEYAPHVRLGTIYLDGTDYLWGPAEEELEKALRDLANG